ncbi:MAG: tetratricopeptide repeat protein, partial [Gammaproteobacteria bacterium]
DQGDAEAQNSLGIMYGIGYGVRQDYKQAVKWYQKAAKQGSAKAQSNLGIVYLNGEGVKQNKATAKEWFGKACEDGNQIGCDNYQKLNK